MLGVWVQGMLAQVDGWSIVSRDGEQAPARVALSHALPTNLVDLLGS